MRFFNTAGPVERERHYCIPPLERVDLGDMLSLVDQRKYFVLHAPRQTGKTSTLIALRDLLNAQGRYRCVYANVEAAQTARDDVEQAMRIVLGVLASRARVALGDDFLAKEWPGIFAEFGPAALGEALTRWCQAGDRPLVVLIDEIDALAGDSLLSALRQLRSGYDQRPGAFPQSLALCGVRDVRDYRIRSRSANELVTGGSAFNVKAKSLRLGDFSVAEATALLQQHTAETGQSFASEALDLVWRQTRGQPWLVNALAAEACFEDKAGRDRSRVIGTAAIRAAQERLIARRETHLDQLADKLKEERVRRVVEPMLSGSDEAEFADRDLEYVRDLGLVAASRPLRVANPIYAEVIPRELTWAAQEEMEAEPTWYVDDEGRLDMPGFLEAFQVFFRANSEHWMGRFQYREAGPQLLLQAFLQRVVNSGGRIEREYGLGRWRTDLLVLWPLAADEREQRFVVECKVLRSSRERTVAKGLEQTARYMDRCDADAGHLIVFDRREGRSWSDRVFRRVATPPDGPAIEVWGM